MIGACKIFERDKLGLRFILGSFLRSMRSYELDSSFVADQEYTYLMGSEMTAYPCYIHTNKIYI